MAIRADLFAPCQKEFSPKHACRTDFGGYRDDDVLPSPPEGFARVLCPNRKCRLPLFIPEQARWVEYDRIPDGEHILDKFPHKGYTTNSTQTPWWRQRCENCGRCGHTAAQCDQRIVAIRCVFCNSFTHDVINCHMAATHRATTHQEPRKHGENNSRMLIRWPITKPQMVDEASQVDQTQVRTNNEMLKGINGRNQNGQLNNNNKPARVRRSFLWSK